MPSTSPEQAKLMSIAAHTPGGYGGVPQSVGKEFHSADKKQGKFKYSGGKKKSYHKDASMKEGMAKMYGKK